MKLTLNIPETLSEVTLDQYQRWLKVADGKELDNFLQQKMIEIFCGITLKQVLMIKAKDIEAIVADISKLFETKDSKFIERFSYNNQEFGFIPKLDDMTFGEYVDLDNYLSDWQLMHKAMGVLFRPITFKKKNQYLIEEYETADKYNMKQMTLDVVFGSIVFFYHLRNELQKHILSYLANQTEVPISQELRTSLRNGAGINLSMDLHKATY
jgi:hypothetical protein|tara:strand:+ start:914 stop:1546 length:633 start_codon:yes stop_codon:yes gene_type:complete